MGNKTNPSAGSAEMPWYSRQGSSRDYRYGAVYRHVFAIVAVQVIAGGVSR